MTDVTQLAPLSLHDVVQVTTVPLMQAVHTSTHWLRLLASNFLYRWAMQARCLSEYSTSCEQDATQMAIVTRIMRLGVCTAGSSSD
jgi:hypothetical protein